MPPIASVGNGNEIQADAAILDDCARDGLEHGNSANMAQPPISDRSLLENLPDEILMEVFEHLVCGENSSTDEPAYDTFTFRGLCLVSKRVDLIARPYLFKKIYIGSPGKLIRLYRTIDDDQHLGGQIKAIDLDLDLDMIELDAADRETLRDDFYQQTGQSGLETSESTRKDCDKIGILCYKLLAEAVNLSSLEMNMNPDEDLDIDSDPGDVEVECLSRYENCSAFFNHVSEAIRSTADRQAAVFLPRLKTLTLWCHTGDMSVEAFEPFLRLPSLRTVRTLGDDGNWSRLSPRADPYEPEVHLHSQQWARRNITTLELMGSLACQYDIEDIAQLFPCLEVLSVESEIRRHGRLKDYITCGRRGALSTKLGKLTALRALRIHIYPDHLNINHLYDNVTASLGPGNVLNLAQLPILEDLEVPLYMFAHIGWLALGGTAAVPQKALPRSLKSLVLLAQLPCGGLRGGPLHKVCWDSVDEALTFLESFGDDLPCFPNLESVAYCFSTLSCGNPFSSAARVQVGQDDEAAEGSVLFRLQAIRASFSRHNVQFLLQEGGFVQEAGERRTIDLEVSEQ